MLFCVGGKDCPGFSNTKKFNLRPPFHKIPTEGVAGRADFSLESINAFFYFKSSVACLLFAYQVSLSLT